MKRIQALIIFTLAIGLFACAGSKAGVRVVGDHLELDDTIHFASGKDAIQDDSFEMLDRIAAILKESPNIVAVHIHGHTDNTGKAEVNQSLSEKRAAAVQAYLEKQGVTQKLDAKGFGQTKPVCEEDTDDCRYRNRRVEFIIDRS